MLFAEQRVAGPIESNTYAAVREAVSAQLVFGVLQLLRLQVHLPGPRFVLNRGLRRRDGLLLHRWRREDVRIFIEPLPIEQLELETRDRIINSYLIFLNHSTNTSIREITCGNEMACALETFSGLKSDLSNKFVGVRRFKFDDSNRNLPCMSPRLKFDATFT